MNKTAETSRVVDDDDDSARTPARSASRWSTLSLLAVDVRRERIRRRTFEGGGEGQRQSEIVLYRRSELCGGERIHTHL